MCGCDLVSCDFLKQKKSLHHTSDIMFKTMLKSESVDSEPESLRMMSELSKKPKLFRRSVTVPSEITSGMRSTPDPEIIDVYEMVKRHFKNLIISCMTNVYLLHANIIKNQQHL